MLTFRVVSITRWALVARNCWLAIWVWRCYISCYIKTSSCTNFVLTPLVPPNYDRVSLRLSTKRFHWQFGLTQKLQNILWRLGLIVSLFPFNCYGRVVKKLQPVFLLFPQAAGPSPKKKKYKPSWVCLLYVAELSLPWLLIRPGLLAVRIIWLAF